jgi:hypothetical protein
MNSAREYLDPDEPMEALLTEEEQAAMEKQEEERRAKLQRLAQALSSKRSAAILFRQESGIEQEWDECDDSYEGMDAANRGDGGFVKSRTLNGGASTPKKSSGTNRSTVFMNITRPYVDSASARVSDMLLPTDDKNWGIRPTPIPELESALKSDVMAPAMPQQAQQPGMMGALNPALQAGNVPAKDVAQQQLDEAKERSEKAEKRIDDWLTECQYHAEVRKVIESAARLGTGVLKGPVPVKKKRRSVKRNGDMIEMIMVEELRPASKAVDLRNLYPDQACGDNIHNGAFIWEKDYWSAKQLRGCAEMPEQLGYLPDEIQEVLEEGPGKRNLESRNRKDVQDDERFEVWYFHGDVSAEDLESTRCDCKAYTTKTIPVIITMVNDRVIKAAVSHLESGEFPYDVMPWQRRSDHWAGIGVAKQMNIAQRMLNAATRNMMDNAGTSSGPQIVIDKEAVRPADGTYDLYGGKVWEKMPEATMDDVRKAFMAVTIESRQDQLMAIIEFSLKMAEEMTGLPLLMQGQTGTAPDTVGGMVLLTNNANSVLRRIARTFDDRVTEPHIRRYYEWLMIYGENEEKGDFSIDARGSTALVERDINSQAILQMGAVAKDPASGLSYAKWTKEMLKAQRMDPKRLEMDEDEKAQLRNQQPPKAPQVEAAEIRSQTDLQKEQMRTQAVMQRAAMDLDRDTAFVQEQRERTAQDAEIAMQELVLKRELAMLEYANRHQISIDQIRAKLADSAMKLKVQKELAGADGRGPQVVTPPNEPPDLAPDGQAYQR